MKLSLVSFLAASALTATSSAFVISTPSVNVERTSVVLAGSRRATKWASKQKWLEARGFDIAMASSTASDSAATTGIMKNADGLEYVKLVHPETGASSEIYLFGGVVTSYKDGEGQEFIAVRPDAKMDGSKPISGGLSHCWPQFGPGAIQQHGFARNVNWTVKSSSETSAVLELAPSDYTKAMWDKDFHVTFAVDLDADQLNTKMVVKNTGSDGFDMQAALHSYFTVSALDKLEIAGSFAGKEFLNKMVDGGTMQTEDRSAITIGEEYDRVYKGVNDPVLKDAGTGKTLSVMNTAGWEDTVLWSPYGNEGMGYNNFVCVESVKFDPVTVAAGESWEGVMALKPGKL